MPDHGGRCLKLRLNDLRRSRLQKRLMITSRMGSSENGDRGILASNIADDRLILVAFWQREHDKRRTLGIGFLQNSLVSGVTEQAEDSSRP